MHIPIGRQGLVGHHRDDHLNPCFWRMWITGDDSGLDFRPVQMEIGVMVLLVLLSFFPKVDSQDITRLAAIVAGWALERILTDLEGSAH